MVRVAVLGCLHGALEDAYRTILMINSSAESSPLDSSAAAAKSKPAASSADVSAPSSASSPSSASAPTSADGAGASAPSAAHAPSGGGGGGAPEEPSGSPASQRHASAEPSDANDAAKIFVGGLAQTTTPYALRQHFAQFGDVQNCHIPTDKYTQRPRGFGFVTFAEPSAVDALLADGDKQNIHGNVVDVRRATGTQSEPTERSTEPVELLLVCGDFQALRNVGPSAVITVEALTRDIDAINIKPKYKIEAIEKDFHAYHTGKKVAPIMTIFVGGNHEASNHLAEIKYGGWVAPNIYFLGYAGVVRYKGLRIAGISGIYKSQDYTRGRYETPPYDDDSIRSTYHTRRFDVFRLKQVNARNGLRTEKVQPQKGVDIFLSHDWPSGIWNHGDYARLVRSKPFLQDDMRSGRLGSPPLWDILHTLKPAYWFAAHLHCKFAAIVPHVEGTTNTRFLALDKCLPRRDFMQILDIEPEGGVTEEAANDSSLQYDLEWLSIVRGCESLDSTTRGEHVLPNDGNTRSGPSDTDDAHVVAHFEANGRDMRIPPMPDDPTARLATEQSRAFLGGILGIGSVRQTAAAADANEIDLLDDDGGGGEDDADDDNEIPLDDDDDM